VPLSDHEQRLLEQMEQQLLSDDPRFASTMRGPRSAPAARRRIIIGVLAVLVGLGLLVVAVANAWVLLGAGAFLVMLAGLVYAFSSPSARSGPVGVVGQDGRPAPRTGSSAARGRHPARGSRGAARSGTFMQRLEQRWDRRRDDRWS